MINLLNNLEVQKVISIDNDYKEYNLEEIKNYIWDHLEEFAPALNESGIKYHDEDIFWVSFDANYEPLIGHSITKELFLLNKKTLVYLENLFANETETVSFVKLPGSNEDVEELFSTTKTSKTLIIIDKILDNYNGIDIIKKLNDENRLLGNFVILLTNEESEGSLDITYDKLGEEIPKTRISVLSKSDLIGKNVDELTNIFKKELHKQYLNVLISQLKDSTTEANYRVNRALLDLEQGFLDSIIFQFSDSEGIQPIENLFRIYNSEFNYSLRKYIGETVKDYADLLYNYEANFSDFRDMTFDYSEMYSFLNHEKFDDTINLYNKAPEFGDIYLINDNIYMLASQECDLIVRGQKDKPIRRVKDGFLINLVENDINFDILNGTISPNEIIRYFTRDNQSYKALFANYKKLLLVDMTYLDFCSFDSEGFSRFKVDQEFDRSRLHTVMFHNYVKKEHLELIEKFEKDIDKISQYINQRYEIQTEKFENEVQLSIKRLCHLEFSSAYMILQNYTSKVGRFPLPGDYAKSKRIIKIVESKSDLINKEASLNAGNQIEDRVYYDDSETGKLSKESSLINFVSKKYSTEKCMFFYIDYETVMKSNAFKFNDLLESGSLYIPQIDDSQKLLDHLESTGNKRHFYYKNRKSYKIRLEDLDINDRIIIDDEAYLQLYVEEDTIRVSFVKQAGD